MEPRQGERRRYPRYPVALNVEVRDGERAAIAGRIRDICLGGVLLSSLDQAWIGQLQPGRELALTIALPVASVVEQLPVTARVVRVIDQAVGLRFEGMTVEALETLQRFIAERSRPAAGEVSGRTSVPLRQRATAILQRITEQRGREILDAWLRAIEEALWDSADQAVNDVQRSQRNGHAVKFSRLVRQGALNQLGHALQRHRAARQGAFQTAAPSLDSLDLVDPDYFETWLESSSLVTHLEEDLEAQLRTLRSQLNRAFGSDEVMDFLPLRLSGAFEAWCEDHGVESDAVRLGLHVGRKTLPRPLGAYYRDLSRALLEAGIDPGDMLSRDWNRTTASRHPPRPQREETAVAAAPPRSQATGPASPPPAPATQVAHMGMAQADSAAAAAVPAALSATEAAELLMALPHDALGVGTQGGTGRPLKEQLLELLSASRPELSGQPLAPVVQDRIDATDRMLKHLAANTSSSSRIRQWVNELGLRVLTAAVADPNFFRQPGHPLMQLLGQLDHIAMVLPDAGMADNEQASAQIDELVERALQVDVRDSDAYGPILDELGVVEQQYGEQFRQDAERAIERLDGQQRRADAHRYVQRELADRFGAERMHRVVAQFIDSAWSTVLELRYLREGQGGQQLQRAWEVLEQLHTLCSRDPAGDAAVAWGVDSLEAEIVQGLSYVGFDPYHAKSMMGKIHETLRKQQTGLSSGEDFLIYTPSKGTTPAESSLEGLDADVLAGLVRQLDALHLGARMRLREAGKESLWRLIWHSPDQDEFAFLDEHNGHVRTFTRDALALGLHDGTLRLQSWLDGGIADRALDATLREMQEHIHYHESRDALTGLHSQQQFNGHLVEMLRNAMPGNPPALAMLEIDHFDVVSSHGGYMAAEQLLQLVSGLLQKRLGDNAFVAFLGGKRFGMILRSDDTEAAQAAFESVRDDLYNLPFRWQGHAFPITGSLGLVFVPPGERNPDVLLSSLELACATAKEAGGNRLVVFSEQDDAITRSKERLRWVSMAEDVIKSERIRLRVQMVAPVDPNAGLSGHHELLVRVYDEQGTELDLEQFIATAETFHLMGEVDRLVIRKALAWGRDNPTLLAQLGGIAINLSGVSLSDPQLLPYIRGQLAACGILPHYISFEVTETAAIASLEQALGIIEGIKEMGCRVALDDFGSGMSSYSYLKTLPVDYVKIDGSFIKDLPNNPNDQAIVKAINEIAHFMGIQTIAEYVLSAEIIGKLNEIGIDFMQGYAVRAPQFLEDLRLSG
jgi:diguanylate cyclase (GGDEF)-like protein